MSCEPGAIAIVQARMGSTRFPGKVLADLCGQPLVDHVIERLGRSQLVDDVIVATTVSPEDDVLVGHLRDIGTVTFRGSQDDVLGRYAACLQSVVPGFTGPIVRVTADCPFINVSVIDRVIELFCEARQCGIVYASNVHPSVYPDGFDVEVFSAGVLMEAARESVLSSEREHVTPYIWKRYHTASLGNPEGDHSCVRLTVDYPDDLEHLQELSKLFNWAADLGSRDARRLSAMVIDGREHWRNAGYSMSLLHDVGDGAVNDG